MRRMIDKALVTIFLVVFPLDILYLYFNGAWSDPNRYVLYAELITCVAVPVWAIVRLFKKEVK